ncbi:MAG: phosphoribosylformylglycinamidine cyclo-ligase [Candidatus Pacebacteria bacterium]|nr:phosphoribosylformylglycinamidine cyclo-ligase [Candidatus Paceibacterota bacterium]
MKKNKKVKSEYEKSGVNISAGNEAVSRMKKDVASTHNKFVLKNIGSFGGLFDLPEILKTYKNPVLVQSIDGVGTKLSVAKMMGRYDTVGEDVVNHSVNDILAMGAKPLTFLDYIANEKLEPQVVASMVKGMSKACVQNGVSLIGGETAEMPGIYTKGEHDLVGCITGIVEKDKIITGEDIKKGDLLLGFASSGLHTNGFSLARRVLFTIAKHTVKTKLPFGESVGDALLHPHLSYTNEIFTLMNKGIKIKGIAHITGGGFVENIPRVLPKNTDAEIAKGSWPVLPIFEYIQKKGKIKEEEMYRVFNMGIGLVVIINPEDKDRVEELLDNNKVSWIGKIIKGKGQVILK